MPVSRTDQSSPGEKQVARLSLFYFNGGTLVQAARKHSGKALGHVLNHEQATWKILGKL
jgi:hypothetical protein